MLIVNEVFCLFEISYLRFIAVQLNKKWSNKAVNGAMSPVAPAML